MGQGVRVSYHTGGGHWGDGLSSEVLEAGEGRAAAGGMKGGKKAHRILVLSMSSLSGHLLRPKLRLHPSRFAPSGKLVHSVRHRLPHLVDRPSRVDPDPLARSVDAVDLGADPVKLGLDEGLKGEDLVAAGGGPGGVEGEGKKAA